MRFNSNLSRIKSHRPADPVGGWRDDERETPQMRFIRIILSRIKSHQPQTSVTNGATTDDAAMKESTNCGETTTEMTTDGMTKERSDS